MKEKEAFTYQIMGKITESGAPIVFKGAMITKLILAENGYTELERQTKDIDANWLGAPPPMDVIVGTISRALIGLSPAVRAVAFREYGDKMSAGVSIRELQTDEEVISMDIDMRPIQGITICCVASFKRLNTPLSFFVFT